MTLKVKVNDPHFQYRLRESQDAYMVQIWWFELKSITSYRTNKPNFLDSQSKWPKWPWRSRLMTSIFNTSQEYPKIHVWCKFGESSPNLWRVIMRTIQISYNSESKWPKWPWSSRSMVPIFNSSWEYPMIMFGANLVILAEICDDVSCRQAQVYGQTDGRADGRTDTRQRQYPFGLKDQGIKMADCCWWLMLRKKQSFMVIKSIAIKFIQACSM